MGFLIHFWYAKQASVRSILFMEKYIHGLCVCVETSVLSQSLNNMLKGVNPETRGSVEKLSSKELPSM